MSTLTTTPVCEECEVEPARVGRHEHRYWSCGYCGTVHRDAA